MDSSDEESDNISLADEQLIGEANHDNHESEDELKNDDDDENKEKKNNKKTKSTSKRIVKNPRVLLNFERLKGPNGIPALNQTFKNFQFRGKHHEKEDLTKIIQSLQHWTCHYLYPGFDFETCTALLEKLGKKRVVQVYMKKLRREMKENAESLHQDNVANTISSNENYENDASHINENTAELVHDLTTSETS